MDARTMGSRGIRIVLFWITVAMVVITDQATKAAMRVLLEDGPKVLIPGVLDLVHVENTGAAFSLGEGAGIVFILVAIAFLVGSVLFVWNTKGLPSNVVVAVGMVAGGGLGNMVDRLMAGSVTDFLATSFIDFPVFNVADICVTVGIVFTVVGYWVWDARTGGEGVDMDVTLPVSSDE